MSLKPSIAKPQNYINVTLPVQSPPRTRGAGQSRSPNNTVFDPNPAPNDDEKHSSSLITVLIAVGANLTASVPNAEPLRLANKQTAQ